MKFKIFNFLIVFALLNMFNMNYAGASELLERGTVLEEDAMVFSLDEAQEMARYISSLEQSVANGNEQIEQQNLLIENKDMQIQTFEEWRELREAQIQKYVEIQKLDEGRIASLEKQARARKAENIGAFVTGILITTGLIIVADQLDDKVLEASPNINSGRSTGIAVRF